MGIRIQIGKVKVVGDHATPVSTSPGRRASEWVLMMAPLEAGRNRFSRQQFLADEVPLLRRHSYPRRAQGQRGAPE